LVVPELRSCPACGYGRGFHVHFRKTEKGIRIGLICPNCGQSYDIDWLEKDVAELTVTEGPVFPSRSD